MGRVRRRRRGAFGSVAVLAIAGLLAPGCASEGTSSAAELPSPFTIAASYSSKALGLDNPRRLAIGPDGNFYITDAGQRVSVFSPELEPLHRWGRKGSAPGEFNFVTSEPSGPWQLAAEIAVGDDGLVVVGDSGNYRLQVFEPSGAFVRSIGRYGDGPGEFRYLVLGLAINQAGEIFVTEDSNAARLSKFSPSGQPQWTRHPGGEGSGHLHMTTIDAHRRLVIVNDPTRVLFVSQAGDVVDEFGLEDSGFGCEATVDERGATFVSGCRQDEDPLREYDREHRLVAAMPSTTASLMTPPILGPDGDRWAFTFEGTLLRLRPTS